MVMAPGGNLGGNAGSLAPPYTGASYQQNLQADVSVPAANTFVDVFALIPLSPGKWRVRARLSVIAVSANTNITAKLWDGVTVYASDQQIQLAGTIFAPHLDVEAIVQVNQQTNLRVSVAFDNAGGGNVKAQIVANNAGCGNTATSVTVQPA